VETDGSLTDIKVIRDLGYGTGAEAVRVLKKSKKWKPGTQNGKPVRVKYTLPISINIQNSGVIGTPPKVDYNPPSYQNQYDNRRF
ncbi:MAG: energy transducer TonB, partial [Flavobacteriaceae bacterium]